MNEETTERATKCGYVALVGEPNAGKSTLLNQCVGQKIAIVTPKAQTTRNRILGVCIEDKTQIVFVDTPGIFSAKEKFEQAMVSAAFSGAKDADIVLLIVDVNRGLRKNLENILEKISTLPARKILVLNKIDSMPRDQLLPLAEKIFAKAEFERSFMISALKGYGVEDVKKWLAEQLPVGHWLFPEDHLTDVPMRSLAAEITREKIFMRLNEELPYQMAVETESWDEKADGSIRISQVVYVRSEGHKKMVVGTGGQMLKAIGQSARRELEKLLDKKVHLFLFVKLTENWKDNPEFYNSIGLEYKK